MHARGYARLCYLDAALTPPALAARRSAPLHAHP